MTDRLTDHFTRAEMECKCGCGAMNMQPELLERLEGLRVFHGEPISITSGTRCSAWNREQGGAAMSAHLDGYAVDMHAGSGRDRHKLVVAAQTVGFTRIGIAKGFIHVDCHPGKYPQVIWSY